jgi:hypothetical protein
MIDNTIDNTTDPPKPEAPQSKKPIDLLTVLTAALVVLAVGTYFAIPGSARAVSIISGLIMVGAIIAGAVKAKRVWGSHGLIAIAVVALLIVSAGSLGAAVAWQLKHTQGYTSVPKQTVTSSSAQALAFQAARNTVVPYCSTFYGTGTIPKGDALLIFDSPADSTGNLLTPLQYGFHGAATPLSHGWRIDNVTILSKNLGKNDSHRAVVFGVLENDQDAQFVERITASNNGYWRSGSLPLGLGRIAPLPVVRSDSPGC